MSANRVSLTDVDSTLSTSTSHLKEMTLIADFGVERFFLNPARDQVLLDTSQASSAASCRQEISRETLDILAQPCQVDTHVGSKTFSVFVIFSD